MTSSDESKPEPRKRARRQSEATTPAETGESSLVANSAAIEGQAARAASPFPIVGVGASAGGLAAFQRLLAAMTPEAEGMLALVLVQHLDPGRKSMLTELVSRNTRMRVYEVTDGMRVEPGAIYVIPPNNDLALVKGRLHLTEPIAPRGLRLPIDFFFRSMAEDLNGRAICVVLSGGGTDGALGLRAVKEAGGLALAQDPDSAQYDAMPRSAIATGLTDFILPPERIPEQLLAYLKHMPTITVQLAAGPPEIRGQALQKIFSLLHTQTGHDFSRYKHNTINRRIERRMALHQVETLDAYVRYLQESPAEVTALFKELLIGVTKFFRDPQAFEILEERVIPSLFADKRDTEPVRVWVAGCSTGEEAYSIGILLQEFITERKLDTRVQVFATDIDAEALERARSGDYPNNIAADVSAERLSRFFVEKNSAYRIKKIIRDMMVFAEQDVGEDPPFSRIDLISCRNLLIYMSGELQRRVLPLFHYALVPGGYLFLGSSETVGDFAELFSAVHRKWKIFVRKPGFLVQRGIVNLSHTPSALGLPSRRVTRPDHQEGYIDMRQIVEQTLLSEHAPPAVVVNEAGSVLYVHGRTGNYLEPAPGEASLNVLRMAREGLRLELATALRRAVADHEVVVERGLRVRSNGDFQIIDLTVRPLQETAQAQKLFLIVFAEIPLTNPPPGEHLPAPGDKDRRISHLERELHSKEEYLQTMVEELETSNEELTSTNEELQSANEELQSTNEELETSKEELQSVNEELMTVNMELQKKLEDFSNVNNDLNNLLASTGIGTVFVDQQLRIQRFTPAATAIINLLPTDVGRPVAHLVTNLVDSRDLVKDVSAVLQTLVAKEVEIQVRDGNWYLMRIQPYRTTENGVEGAVMTFVQITMQKKMQAALDESQRLQVAGLGDPAFVLDLYGRILDCSEVAAQWTGYTRSELRTLPAQRLMTGGRDQDFLEVLRQVSDSGGEFEAKVQTKDGRLLCAEVRLQRFLVQGEAAMFAIMRECTKSEHSADSPTR